MFLIKKRRTTISSLLFLLFPLLHGCAFHSEPKDNSEFLPVSQLAELAGIYRNQGEPNGYFSLDALHLDGVHHEEIDFAEISVSNNLFIAKMIKDGCVTYEKSYVIGRDVELEDGKLLLHQESHALSRGADDVLVGPSYDKVVFGLDTTKNGKLRRSGYGAGLVFMLFPLAASEQTDIRFKRVNDIPQGLSRCSH